MPAHRGNRRISSLHFERKRQVKRRQVVAARNTLWRVFKKPATRFCERADRSACKLTLMRLVGLSARAVRVAFCGVRVGVQIG